MTGWVDSARRALLSVSLRGHPDGDAAAVDVWIDTGFSGDLVLPNKVVSALGLPEYGDTLAHLADGTETRLPVYRGLMTWGAKEEPVFIAASENMYPLIGTGLLADYRLVIDYRRRSVELHAD